MPIMWVHIYILTHLSCFRSMKYLLVCLVSQEDQLALVYLEGPENKQKMLTTTIKDKLTPSQKYALIIHHKVILMLNPICELGGYAN